jgi:hypothetical protein
LRKPRIFIDIYFKDNGFITDGPFYFFQDGCHRFTGATPGSKKVNEDRFVAIYEIGE